MEKRFLVFVVFVIVTQSSVLLSSAIFTGFPEEGVFLNLLEYKHLESRSERIIGFDSFFNSLENRTGQASSHQDLSLFVDALSRATESIDIIFYSALIVSQEDCNEFNIALNETQAQYKEVIETIVSSVGLAQGGNYEENRSEIEKNGNLTVTGLVSAYGTLFDFLRCCLNVSNDEFLHLLGEVQEKVNENCGVISNAIYEAIEAYSILTSDCTEDEAAAALVSIEKSRFIVIATTIDNIERIFCLYETSYIDNYLNGTRIVHRLFDIRLARKTTSDKLEETMEVVFLAIEERLLEHTSHHEIERSNRTLNDPTQAIAVHLIQSAEEHFLETVLLIRPNSTDNVTVAKIILPHVLQVVIGHYYEGMDLAEAGLPENVTLSVIKSVEKIQTLVTNFVVAKCFEIIGSKPLTEAKLTMLQNRVVVGLQEASDAAFDAIKVLSKVAHANEEASQDDFDEVHSYRTIAISAVRVAVRNQLHAVLYEFVVENGY